MFVLFVLYFACTVANVRISEVVPHSDVEDGYYDYVELWNDNDKPADISGHFLTDAGSKPTKCQLKAGTILAPDEYRSFSFQSLGETRGGEPLVADCPFRLSKHNDRIYYGKTHNGLANGNYTEIDNMNIGGTINRLSNALWPTKDKKDRNMMSFPTENLPNRYPIVGPLTMTEIVWDVPAGKLQWIKFTCIYGQYPNTYTSPCRMSNRQGRPYRLRLEAQKDLFTDADVATPSSLDIPVSFTLPNQASCYLTNGDPAAFKAMYKDDPRLGKLDYVFGPWVGDLVNKTTKEVFAGISTQEHTADWWVEKFHWKPDPKEWRTPNNGGMYKLSLAGTSPEPDNWVGLGQFVPCNLTAEFPQSDCPTLDMCTAAQCVNVSGVGQCRYNSLVCNHPNFDLCYPMHICKLPAPSRYNGNRLPGGNASLGGCYITNQIFGHTTSDITAFGMYPPYPETMYWNVGCVRQAIDCDLGKWTKWSYCPKCDAKYNSTRVRSLKMPASKNPDGKCGALTETRSCATQGVNDMVCDRINFKFVNWGKHWVEFTNPSNLPIDISDWVLKQGPCDLTKPDGAWTDFKKDTVLLPGDTIRKELKDVVTHARGTQNNVICLMEARSSGTLTGAYIQFDEKGNHLPSLHS